MKRCLLAAGALAASLAAGGAAEPRVKVPDAKTLMIAAIDAADGRAHGVLTGEVADAVTQTFQATFPVYIDVSTEKRYGQQGCARLKVTFWQDGVRLPSGTAGCLLPLRRQTIEFGVNKCRDGQPPRSLR